MRRALLGVVLAALALAGCGARPPMASRPAATVPRKPVAVLVAEQVWTNPTSHMPSEPHARVLRIPLDGTTATPLPVSAPIRQPPRLSPDGHALLFIESQPLFIGGYMPRHLYRYDLASHLTTTLLEGPISTFGWTAEGRPEAVTTSPKAAPSFIGSQSLGAATVHVLVAGHWRDRAIDTTQARATAVDFLAAHGDLVYLEMIDASSPNGSQASVWRLDTHSGALTDLADLQPLGLGSAFESVPPAGGSQPPLSSQTLLGVGVPVEHQIGGNGHGVSAVDVRRLSDMRVLRSFVVTPVAELPVYDDTLTRFLVEAPTGRRGYFDLRLTDTRSGETTTLVAATKTLPDPQPVGFAGDAVLFRSVTNRRVTLWSWSRTAGVRELADLGEWPDRSNRWYPATTLLGVEYER